MSQVVHQLAGIEGGAEFELADGFTNMLVLTGGSEKLTYIVRSIRDGRTPIGASVSMLEGRSEAMHYAGGEMQRSVGGQGLVELEARRLVLRAMPTVSFLRHSTLPTVVVRGECSMSSSDTVPSLALSDRVHVVVRIGRWTPHRSRSRSRSVEVARVAIAHEG